MIAVQQHRLPFVIFELKGCLYGISSKSVVAIISPSQVTGIPEAPPEVRGVINARGRMIKLIDLRVKLGLPARQTELQSLVQLLHEREQDHRNWLTELEASAREHRPFKLARDPHQCKFGKWYDAYKTQDQILGMVLPSMDAPHKAIHAVADAVLERANRGDETGALALINARRNQELAGLVKLFGEARRILSDGCHEVFIILTHGEEVIAITTDRVETSEHIAEENIEPMPPVLQHFKGTLNWRVARRPRDNRTILLLDEDSLFSHREAIASSC